MVVRLRGQVARIYGRGKLGLYRVAHRAGGRRVVRAFTTYSAARAAAEEAVRRWLVATRPRL